MVGLNFTRTATSAYRPTIFNYQGLILHVPLAYGTSDLSSISVRTRHSDPT